MSGLLQRIFPFLGGAEAKVERARTHLANGEYMKARWDVVELNHPAAADHLALVADLLH